ncbi:nickel pincer cofactor biosynthesis protein LarC [bacterium]|nr:nickel pincer cofactor biosynthesis protein LarC [bacterium]
MKIAYFDCFSGISGDMIVGALLDAGLDLEELKAELSKLGLKGHRESAGRVERVAITGTKFDVETDETGHGRTVAEIARLLEESTLSDDVRATVTAVVGEIGRVESRIHGRPLDELHLHETSGLDSIVDIVASVAGLKMLGVEAVSASKIHVGTGFVECAHGTLPVPAPATIALLKGIPVYSRGVESELTTPTGAALIRVLAEDFGAMPEMRVEAVGYGAGARELEIPNMLRVVIGETSEAPFETDEVVLIEANLDDMNPEYFGHASDLLRERGAIDVYLTPVYMKKGRPGTMLTVLAPKDHVDGVVTTLFEETTTLGVRMSSVQRKKLAREVIDVKTSFGIVGVKLGRSGSRVVSIAPEYEDCRKAARASAVPLSEVYDEARALARKVAVAR